MVKVQKEKLQQTIDNSHANSYIKLKGHVNLAEVYKQYELYLSGSTSEGFGLTLMEAVGSGLGIIGFDVYYGNTHLSIIISMVLKYLLIQ